MLNVAWALSLLKVVPQVVAAAPEFKRLYDQLVASFDKDADQETLQRAYDLALSDAEDAHDDLDELVRANS